MVVRWLRSLPHWLGLVLFLVSCGDDSPTQFVDVQYCNELVTAAPASRRGADPLLSYQWYLDRVGIRELWQRGYEGEGVHISIVDDALELMHEDLRGNIEPDLSRNYLEPLFSDMRFNPMPVDCAEDGHGTAVAGILAASGDNGIGIKGVAYKSKIYLANYLATRRNPDLRNALGLHSDRTAVSSNSWGAGTASRLRRLDSSARMVIRSRLLEGFGDKGVSYVFAAGNSRVINEDVVEGPGARASSDMASYSEMLNYPGIIVACAVNANDRYASYSSPGANLWLCGPSGDTMAPNFEMLEDNPDFLNYYHIGLPTTDLSGEAGYNQVAMRPPNSNISLAEFDDYLDFGWGGFALNFTVSNGRVAQELPLISFEAPPNPQQLADGVSLSLYRQPGNSNYTRFFQGTSAATPVVSGVIALLRAEDPNLTWRDIMLILAESAEQVDSHAASWQQGASAYHDSTKQYTHSIDYGFGLINATAAMDLAAQWSLLPAAKKPYSTSVQSRTLNAARKEFSITVPDIGINFIEYVQLAIDSNYPYFGHLRIKLVSPQGVESVLTDSHTCLDWDDNLEVATVADDCPDLQGGFIFGAAAHLGADPQGDWRLVIERIRLQAPDLSWQLTFHGH